MSASPSSYRRPSYPCPSYSGSSRFRSRRSSLPAHLRFPFRLSLQCCRCYSCSRSSMPVSFRSSLRRSVLRRRPVSPLPLQRSRAERTRSPRSSRLRAGPQRRSCRCAVVPRLERFWFRLLRGPRGRVVRHSPPTGFVPSYVVSVEHPVAAISGGRRSLGEPTRLYRRIQLLRFRHVDAGHTLEIRINSPRAFYANVTRAALRRPSCPLYVTCSMLWCWWFGARASRAA
jgi:hypothetical protein